MSLRGLIFLLRFAQQSQGGSATVSGYCLQHKQLRRNIGCVCMIREVCGPLMGDKWPLRDTKSERADASKIRGVVTSLTIRCHIWKYFQPSIRLVA